jgi:hypothetical protein
MKTIPFPQCLVSGSNSNYLQSSYLQDAFDKALDAEEQSATYERAENSYKQNCNKTKPKIIVNVYSFSR